MFLFFFVSFLYLPFIHFITCGLSLKASHFLWRCPFTLDILYLQNTEAWKMQTSNRPTFFHVLLYHDVMSNTGWSWCNFFCFSLFPSVSLLFALWRLWALGRFHLRSLLFFFSISYFCSFLCSTYLTWYFMGMKAEAEWHCMNFSFLFSFCSCFCFGGFVWRRFFAKVFLRFLGARDKYK